MSMKWAPIVAWTVSLIICVWLINIHIVSFIAVLMKICHLYPNIMILPNSYFSHIGLNVRYKYTIIEMYRILLFPPRVQKWLFSQSSHCLNQCWNIVNWTLGNTQMHLKMSPAKWRPSLLDLSALTAAVATDSFDPVVHYVKVTHWPSDNVFTHPLVPECPKKISNHFSPKATCILRGLFG